MTGLEIQKLKTGEFFGSRAIIKEKPGAAKFSIVADSLEVKIFVITRKHFPILPDSILVKHK